MLLSDGSFWLAGKCSSFDSAKSVCEVLSVGVGGATEMRFCYAVHKGGLGTPKPETDVSRLALSRRAGDVSPLIAIPAIIPIYL